MDDHNKSNNDCNYQTWNTLIQSRNIDIQSSNPPRKKCFNVTFLHIWFLELAALAELWCTNKKPHNILKLSDMSEERPGQVMEGGEMRWPP